MLSVFMFNEELFISGFLETEDLFIYMTNNGMSNNCDMSKFHTFSFRLGFSLSTFYSRTN